MILYNYGLPENLHFSLNWITGIGGQFKLMRFQPPNKGLLQKYEAYGLYFMLEKIKYIYEL